MTLREGGLGSRSQELVIAAARSSDTSVCSFICFMSAVLSCYLESTN